MVTVISENVLSRKVLLSKDGRQRLVGNSEHGNNVLVLRLRDKLSKNSNVVKRTLGVRKSHRSIQHVDRAELARVVPAVLTAGKRVQVEVDTDAVFASPLDGFQEVPKTNLELGPGIEAVVHLLPAGVREERLVVPDFDRPVR